MNSSKAINSALITIIGKLESLGYDFYIEEDKMKYRYILPNNPPAEAGALLGELRSQRGEAIEQLKFKIMFNRLVEHLRQRDYTTENMKKLEILSNKIDKAWQELNYSTFKEGVAEMMRIPGALRLEGMPPLALWIYVKKLKESVWLVKSPEAIPFIPEGEIYYLLEEVQHLREATSVDIQAVHRAKKELKGRLIEVTERAGKA